MATDKVPRLEYLTRYLTAFLIVSSHPFLLIASLHPRSPSRLSTFRGWSVCWQRAERKRKGREGRKPLEIGNAEKTVGLLRCRVRSCSRVDPARVGIKRGKGVSHGGNFCSRLVVGDLLFFFFWDLKGFD